jgi:hypothetical protein
MRYPILSLLACFLLPLWSCSGGSDNPDPADTGVQDAETKGDTAVVPDLAVPEDVQEEDVPVAQPDTADQEVTPEQWFQLIDGPCDASNRIGHFEVLTGQQFLISGELWKFVWFDGSATDQIDALQENPLISDFGPCRLYQMKEGAFCDPPCGPEEQCTHSAGCVPFPVPQDLGKVTVTGLTDPVEIDTPKGGLKKYSYYEFEGDPFLPGSFIEMTAAGLDLPGFTLHGLGVDKPAFTHTEWLLESGVPIEIEWVPSELPSTIFLWIMADLHGVTPVRLVCELEDTGAFTISGEIVAEIFKYPMLDTAIPAVSLARHTVDSIENKKGCIEFEVASQVVGKMKFE